MAAFPDVLLGSPRDDAGNLIMLGSGQQHWATVHVADLAEFFRRVLESDTARGFYVVADGFEPDRRRAHRGGCRRRRRTGSGPRLRRRGPRPRLGDYFAEVLLLDQGTSSARARAELDWHPSHPALADEFRTGSYRTVTAAP